MDIHGLRDEVCAFLGGRCNPLEFRFPQGAASQRGMVLQGNQVVEGPAVRTYLGMCFFLF